MRWQGTHVSACRAKLGMDHPGQMLFPHDCRSSRGQASATGAQEARCSITLLKAESNSSCSSHIIGPPLTLEKHLCAHGLDLNKVTVWYITRKIYPPGNGDIFSKTIPTRNSTQTNISWEAREIQINAGEFLRCYLLAKLAIILLPFKSRGQAQAG